MPGGRLDSGPLTSSMSGTLSLLVVEEKRQRVPGEREASCGPAYVASVTWRGSQLLLPHRMSEERLEFVRCSLYTEVMLWF